MPKKYNNGPAWALPCILATTALVALLGFTTKGYTDWTFGLGIDEPPVSEEVPGTSEELPGTSEEIPGTSEEPGTSEKTPIDENAYTIISQYGKENCWTKNDDNSLTSTGNSMYDQYLIFDYKTTGLSDYTISVNMKGTMSFPTTKDVQAGLILWYQDENNYIMSYLQWSMSKTDSLQQIQFTGRVDGEYLEIKDKTESTAWNDLWTDGNTTSADSDINFKVVRKASESQHDYSFYINESLIGSFSLLNEKALTEEGKVGLYAHNDTFTFSNLSLEK